MDAVPPPDPPHPPRARREVAPAQRTCAVVVNEPVREPYNAGILFAFLEGRALPGIEEVSGRRYRRRLEGETWIAAELADGELRITIPTAATARTAEVTARLRRLFDLDAEPARIDRHLAKQPLLANSVRTAPGIRVPGVWDAFEGAVRAVLGQQVSVARATKLAGLLCERFGDGAFPAPEVLARAEVASIGLPRMRGRAISSIAERVAGEGVGWLGDADSLRAGFLAIPGLGPWTAEYAAMRVARDGDAFPDSDWGVVKALGRKGVAARRWAEPCRPWRAYAVMRLWCSDIQYNPDS